MATLKQTFLLRIAFFVLFIYALHNESQWDSVLFWNLQTFILWTIVFSKSLILYCITQKKNTYSLFYLITVIASFSDFKDWVSAI